MCDYWRRKFEELSTVLRDEQKNFARLEAQTDALNKQGLHCYLHLDQTHPPNTVREMKEEIGFLLEYSSYVGEVIKVMGKGRALVKACFMHALRSATHSVPS